METFHVVVACARLHKGGCSTTLIVCPLSVLGNWTKQIKASAVDVFQALFLAPFG